MARFATMTCGWWVKATLPAIVAPLLWFGCAASAPAPNNSNTQPSALPTQQQTAVAQPTHQAAVPVRRPPLVINITEEENAQLRHEAEERERRYQSQEIAEFGRVLTDGERREVRKYGRVLGEQERVELARIAAEREAQREENELRRRELRLEEERLKRRAELEAERLAIERERNEVWRPFWPHQSWHRYPVPPPAIPPISLE